MYRTSRAQTLAIRKSVAILGVAAWTLLGSSAVEPLRADQPAEQPWVKIKSNTWQQFPLMMINVRPVDVPDVAHLVDIVSYYSTFAPVEPVNGVLPVEADLESFRYALQAEPLIDAAAAHGIHATVTPGFFASVNAQGGDPLFAGDGLVVGPQQNLFVNPAVVPGCNDPMVDAACIQVPYTQDQITPEYLDYWAAKLPNFLQAVDTADPGGVLWGIYGIEEVRHWATSGKYGGQRLLRLAMDASPLSHLPLVAYTAHNRMPESLAWTVLSVPGVADAVGSLNVVHSPPSPVSFLPKWTDPMANCNLGVGPACQVAGLTDYYPLPQDFATDAQGGLMPLQTHLMRGSYLNLLMGTLGHTSRIASIHRMDAQLETAENVRQTYIGNGQHPPKHLAFHLPDMNLCSLAESNPSAAEARHDFWSGLHRGQGVFIYNYNFVVQALAAQDAGVLNTVCDLDPTPEQVLTVWDEYKIGLRLLKHTMRPYMVGGKRTEPVLFSHLGAETLTVIPGTDYLIDHPIPGADATFAMPDYPAVNGSSHRIDSVAYLIVTSSYDQNVRFTVPFDDPICSVSVIHGDGGTVSFTGNELSDSMSGIDGRVYRVELAERGQCP